MYFQVRSAATPRDMSRSSGAWQRLQWLWNGIGGFVVLLLVYAALLELNRAPTSVMQMPPEPSAAIPQEGFGESDNAEEAKQSTRLRSATRGASDSAQRPPDDAQHYHICWSSGTPPSQHCSPSSPAPSARCSLLLFFLPPAAPSPQTAPFP
ncbi:unnamed protein product [Closterium sp. Yama58-4]|nr:unnamed protein product [Closterium sp. Yama58-4]